MDSEKTTQNSEWVTKNVRRYWLFEKQVVVYEVTGFTRPIVDEWYDTVSSTLQTWPPENQMMIAIHDLRAASLTPYTRHKSQQLAQENNHLFGYSVIVIPNTLYTLFGNFMQIFLNTVLSRTQPKITRHICTSMEDAVAYVEKVLNT